MTVECPKCEVLNRDGATFCDRCGSRLSSRAPARMAAATSESGRGAEGTPPAGIVPEVMPQNEGERSDAETALGPAGIGWRLPSQEKPCAPTAPSATNDRPAAGAVLGRRKAIERAAPHPLRTLARAATALLLAAAITVATIGAIGIVSAARGDDRFIAGLLVIGVAIAAAGLCRLLAGGIARRVITGEARAIQRCMEEALGTQRTVLSFRVERYDAAGDRVAPVPVEMRGRRFNGAISEGDWVEVRGAWRAGGTMRPARVRNLTTGATVAADGGSARRIANGISWVLLTSLVVYVGGVIVGRFGR